METGAFLSKDDSVSSVVEGDGPHKVNDKHDDFTGFVEPIHLLVSSFTGCDTRSISDIWHEISDNFLLGIRVSARVIRMALALAHESHDME